MTRLLAILFLATACHAQNILGTSPDFMNGGPSQTAIQKQLGAGTIRFQARMADIMPAPGYFNFTNVPTCNDTLISNAVAQGQKVMLDIWWWPSWVQTTNEWPNRYNDMAAYVTAVLNRWPKIVWLGCWNEPSATQGNPMTIVPGLTNATPLQLMTEYHALVTCIYDAAKSVNPNVKFNIGKFDGYHPELNALLKSLGTWAMADLITYHDNDDEFGPPLVDAATNGVTFPYSVAHKYAAMAALFPGKQFGCDEYYPWSPFTAAEHAAAARKAGSSLECWMLGPYAPPPGTTIPGCYGITNGVLNETAINLVNILTTP
jgi:hypothetical protein